GPCRRRCVRCPSHDRPDRSGIVSPPGDKRLRLLLPTGEPVLFFLIQLVLHREAANRTLGLAKLLFKLRLSCGTSAVGEAFLSGFEHGLLPLVIHGLGDAMAPADFRDRLLAPESFENYLQLRFGCPTTTLFGGLLFLAHLVSLPCRCIRRASSLSVTSLSTFCWGQYNAYLAPRPVSMIHTVFTAMKRSSQRGRCFT